MWTRRCYNRSSLGWSNFADKTKMNTEQARALLVAGQLAGLASRLNVAELEKYLANRPPPDFNYEKLCRAAIEFVKAIQKLDLPDDFTVS
jgi:hypothetical protein